MCLLFLFFNAERRKSKTFVVIIVHAKHFIFPSWSLRGKMCFGFSHCPNWFSFFLSTKHNIHTHTFIIDKFKQRRKQNYRFFFKPLNRASPESIIALIQCFIFLSFGSKATSSSFKKRIKINENERKTIKIKAKGWFTNDKLVRLLTLCVNKAAK